MNKVRFALPIRTPLGGYAATQPIASVPYEFPTHEVDAVEANNLIEFLHRSYIYAKSEGLNPTGLSLSPDDAAAFTAYAELLQLSGKTFAEDPRVFRWQSLKIYVGSTTTFMLNVTDWTKLWEARRRNDN